MAPQPTGTVTLLFTDIEGSTRLLQRLGREGYASALGRHSDLLLETFERHGGYVVGSEGDSLFVAFAGAEAAVAAAEEAQRALAAAEWPSGEAIRVRMGLHTGEPLVVPPAYVGLDVHKAARVMAAGHGGQVLMSAATWALVGSSVESVSLGEHRLKDLLQPEPIYQLRIDGLQSVFPALKTLGGHRTNLPVQANAFIGREAELVDVVALVRDPAVRLVTLTGPGGTGKTRLALHVGAEVVGEFADGVYFVSLAPIRDVYRVLPAIARTLALREVPGEAAVETLAAHLAEKESLLVIDNLEQVIESSPHLAALLARCPRLKLLATSRERLRVVAETVYEVPPLVLPDRRDDLVSIAGYDAVALFAVRARALDRDFSVHPGNVEVIAEICRRLDGLPLAIELAAARGATLGPESLLRRLDQRLQLLGGGPRDADEQKRTLRDTIAWSYELLSDSEQNVFAQMSVFADGAHLDAAEAVCDGSDVVSAVVSLFEKSLLRRRTDPDGETRFWMLETVRDFAQERLATSEHEDATRERHAHWYLAVATSAIAEIEGAGTDQRAAEAVMEVEQANLRAALAWFEESRQPERFAQMVGALARYWFERGEYSEGRRWGERALAALPPQATALRAEMLMLTFFHMVSLGDLDAARPLADERLDIAEQLNDRGERAGALLSAAELAARESDLTRAIDLGREAVALRRAGNDPSRLASALANLGINLFMAGALDDARGALEEAHAIH